MEYIIRKCEEKDLPKLVELCRKHSEFEEAKYDSTGKEILLRNAIFSDSQRLFCFVIESNNVLEGYFTYTFDFSTWDAKGFLYLDCLYLEPKVRGFRIGEKIFEQLKEIAKESD